MIQSPLRRLPARGWLAWLMLFVALTAGAAFWAYTLWNQPPHYWIDNKQTLERLTIQQREDLAHALFNRAISEYADVEQYEPLSGQAAEPANYTGRTRTISLPLEQINVWLHQQLVTWLANQGIAVPPEIVGVMLAHDDGQPVIAFHYQSPDTDQIISLKWNLVPKPEGKIAVVLDGVRGGTLPIPTPIITNKLQQKLKTLEADHPLQKLSLILQEKPFNPILPFDGSRFARLTNLTIGSNQINLTFRTEKKKP